MDDKIVVLVDVDGVLADFVGATLGIIEEKTGNRFRKSDIKEWNIEKCVGHENFNVCIPRFNEPGFASDVLKPLSGARRGIARLAKIASIYVVTSPWKLSMTWVYDRNEWLARYFAIGQDRIINTAKKHLIRGDVLVDDGTHNIKDWKSKNPDGVAILWDAPYNQDSTLHDVRTNSWTIVEKIVVNRAKCV